MFNRYVFDDKDHLVKYLYNKLSNPTQIKVQKTLYLLYAFYGASYGKLTNTEDDEFSGQNYPPELFRAKFQAWRYGPVEVDVYAKEKNGMYENPNEFELKSETSEEKNIKQFVDSIVSQTDDIDDFSLVDRTHQDNAWLNKYEEGINHIPMDNKEIVEEYAERYL